MTAYPKRNPKISKQMKVFRHNTLLESLSEALDDYENFTDLQLNSRQFHIHGELLDFLFSADNFPQWPILILVTLIWPSTKLSGTYPGEDAESFIQLIERKIIFAPGDAPGDAVELANYTFRKKALISSLLRGPAADWYENNITKTTSWENVRTNIIARFSDGRNKFRYRMEVEHCIKVDGKEIQNFYTVSNERLIMAGSMI